MNLKKINCDETWQLEFWQDSKTKVVMNLKKTQIGIKLKNSNFYENKILKL